MILGLKTDNPVTELYLLTPKGEIAYQDIWRSDRALSVQLHRHIDDLLHQAEITPEQLDGIVAFAGPGSFTGLRIGLSVANAMAYALQLPIVAMRGNDWLTNGVTELKDTKPGGQVLPFYGGEANITQPRK
ncbi:MAG: tRNA (adenosine(37)-N6)-threonylcarbamoyltransferase complex dimerization subunit type 1 TsaB [Candidatus Saccharimonadales bacterium]